MKEYKCELNSDVEYFLKEKAIEFSKQDFARTYIVMSQYKGKDERDKNSGDYLLQMLCDLSKRN